MEKQKSFLITGGAGFIGSHLVDRLLALGHAVVVIDNFSSGKRENILEQKNNPHFILYERDVCGDLSDIFINHRFDALIHLAALSRVQDSIANPHHTHHVNVNGTINALHACKVHSVPRFVFASSAAVYGNQNVLPVHEDLPRLPLSPYALHKAIGEEYCTLFYSLYGIETIALRYFNVYGPRQDPLSDNASLVPTFVHLVEAGKAPTINGDGDQTRDLIFIDDIVEATIRAALTDNVGCYGRMMNLARGEQTSVNEVFGLIRSIAGRAVEPLYGPAKLEIRHSCASIERAKQYLSWEPRISLDVGLRTTHSHFSQKNSLTAVHQHQSS